MLDPYMTVSEGRYPKKKFHSKLGDAQAAMSMSIKYGRDCAIYEIVNGKEKLVEEYKRPTQCCTEGCTEYPVKFKFGDTSPLKLRPMQCNLCYYKDQYAKYPEWGIPNAIRVELGLPYFRK